MPRHDDLRHGGHPHRVRTQDASGTDLRGRFILGAGHVHIDALPHRDFQLVRHLVCDLPQGGSIVVGAVREPGAKFLQVGAAEGRVQDELDVILNDHQLPSVPVHIHTASGVGDEQGVRSQQTEHPHGEGHFLKRVPLIVVEPPLHHGHILSFQLTEDQTACMTGCRRRHKVGDVAIGHRDGVFHFIGQITQPGA